MVVAHCSGGLVRNLQDEYVLVKLKRNRWGFPKGHVEKDESLEDTAIREIFEETGISDLNLIKFLGDYQRYSEGSKEVKHLHLYLFFTKQIDFIIDKNHSLGAKWFKKEEITTNLYYLEDRNFIEKVYNEL